MKVNFKNVMILIIVLLSGCKEYLNEKPNKNQVVPSTLLDAQAVLDNPKINSNDLGSGEASADDYYINDARYLAISEEFRRMYTWENSYIYGVVSNDWRKLYDYVYIANTALETLSGAPRTDANRSEWDNVKGQALFFRAHFFFQGAIIWCPAYHEGRSKTDLGLPLRFNTNFNEQSIRSTVDETYMQIIYDLKNAAALLPDHQISVTRPSKQASYALLAKTYLAMRKYEEASAYADSCLKIDHQLLDYASLNLSANFPISPLNAEVLFQSQLAIPSPLSNSNAFIPSDLFQSYADGDLRKPAFFRENTNGTYGFKGSYQGSSAYFSGIAVDEVYLTRAEAFARTGRLSEAMQDLNTLLKKRWAKDQMGNSLYADLTAIGQNDAISKILHHRRKELLLRGLRWMDIKRLNLEGHNITLSRSIDGKTFTLTPNSLRFTLPIPEDIIAISGMQQNKY